MEDIVQAFAQFVEALRQANVKYVVGGSFASGAWGHPRATNDLDIAIRLESDRVGALIELLGDEFSVDTVAVRHCLESADEYRSFQIVHLPSMLTIDAFIPPHSPFSKSVFSRAHTVRVFIGVEANCMSAEDIVIQKLRWFVLGNRVSDKQWNDIVQVLEVQGPRLDQDYLRQWAEYFGLQDLLGQALKQALQDQQTQ